MAPALYRGLILLHPAAFRRRFGEEMLWIFSESSANRSSAPLFLDALLSLARQWLLRSGLWKVVVATAGGLATMAGAGALSTLVRAHAVPVHKAVSPEFVLLAAVSCLIPVFFTTILAVCWFGVSRRRRHA